MRPVEGEPSAADADALAPSFLGPAAYQATVKGWWRPRWAMGIGLLLLVMVAFNLQLTERFETTDSSSTLTAESSGDEDGPVAAIIHDANWRSFTEQVAAVERSPLGIFDEDQLAALAVANCELVTIYDGDIDRSRAELASITYSLTDPQLESLMISSINTYCSEWTDNLLSWQESFQAD